MNSHLQLWIPDEVSEPSHVGWHATFQAHTWGEEGRSQQGHPWERISLKKSLISRALHTWLWTSQKIIINTKYIYIYTHFHDQLHDSNTNLHESRSNGETSAGSWYRSWVLGLSHPNNFMPVQDRYTYCFGSHCVLTCMFKFISVALQITFPKGNTLTSQQDWSAPIIGK